MNIFDISNELKNIFQEIEDNDGELTPELEAELNSSETNLKEKIEGYTAYIKYLENDTNLIDAEMARLRHLKEVKNKTIARLKTILLQIINEFGDCQKNGVRYIDYGTGKISTRKSTVVEVNKELADNIVENAFLNLAWLKANNELNIVDAVNEKDILEVVSSKFNVTPDDLRSVDTEVTFRFPVCDLFNGKAYTAIRDILHYTDTIVSKAVIDKTKLKQKLTENGACAPNLASLNTNYNIIIK